MDRLQLDTQFTTNHYAIMHKIQKKNIAEANSVLVVTSVLKTSNQGHLSFERETERAFDGQGKLETTVRLNYFRIVLLHLQEKV